MRIIEARAEILNKDRIDGQQILKDLELISRTCYKSENCIKDGTAERLVKFLVDKGHEAMIEHCSISVKFIVDRSIANEIVRHRVASYAQESTRYVNYSKDKFGNEITFIAPPAKKLNIIQIFCIRETLKVIEKAYFKLLKEGSTPEIARNILPLCTKTELVMTTNLREWRHFFKLRIAKTAHPQMREITIPLLKEFKQLIPIIFDDIEVEDDYEKNI